MKTTPLAAGARATLIAVVALMALDAETPALAQERDAASATSESEVNADQTAPTPKQDTDAPVYAMNPEGGTVWGLFTGFGFTQEINGSRGDTNIASAGLRWSHLFGEKFGGVFRGHPAFAIELLPVLTFIEDDRTTWAAGFNLLYEHHFTSRRRVRPVWRIGAGFLYANQEIPEGETQHNFSLLMGFGLDIMTSARKALYLGYRFHHVSNADTGDRNPGFNAHTIMFGVTFYR